MTPLRTWGSLLLLTGGLLAMPATAKKKDKTPAPTVKTDSVSANPIASATRGTQKIEGLFTLYFDKKKGELFFELPKEAFEKTYMLASRIASTSDGSDYVAGQMNVSPFAITFSNDGRNVYMHQVMSLNVLADGDPIKPSFDNNNLQPVLTGFKIVATDKDRVLINVTRFFTSNERSISPLKNASPLTKLLGGSEGIKATFSPEGSGFVYAKAFEQNIEIESLLSFQTTGAVQKPYSVIVHRSLFALPDHDPMPIRLQDNRVGFFNSTRNVFSSDADRVDTKTFIHRWRLRPRAEDMDRYFAGQLVEPEQPIIFYVDPAFPEKWRGTIKEGIEVWNKAFEEAGFKNAIRALDYPNDPSFDPDDMRYNCFRYVVTQTANAMGPSYVDPRTGEILAADVIWYHNILSLLHNWRFVQTGAVDSRVRQPKFDDDVMRESIKYAASHEIGHTLGLMHNMGASYSYPVESLRDPAFTQRYGTTPSIMDYARNNYVAQPGDVERGVSLTPPELGVYDIFAINWGYRLIKGATTPESEKAVLDSWITNKVDDPMYQFGAQQFFATIDPTAQTEDLGNDHIKAGNYGIKNLKVLLNNFEQWTMERGERYEQVENKYLEVTKQYGRYVRHVLPMVGGVQFHEIRQGDGKTAAQTYLPKAKQKQALDWLLNQMLTYDQWLTPKRLIQKLEVNMNINDRLRSQIVGALFNSSLLFRIGEGEKLDPVRNYTIEGYLDDLTRGVFTAPKGGRLTPAEQDLQTAAIAVMIKQSGLQPAAKSASASLDADHSDEFALEPLESSFCCSHHLHESQFSRINMGLPALSNSQMGALMLGRLQRVLSQYRAFRAQATGTTRDFYNYQILQIEKVLEK